MARQVSRDDLLLLLEELDRGEATKRQLEEMVQALELSISDAEALEIMQDEELTSAEIADELTGYSDREA